MRLEIKKVVEKKVGELVEVKYIAVIDGETCENHKIFHKLFGITGEDGYGILESSETRNISIRIAEDKHEFLWGRIPKEPLGMQMEIQKRIDEVKKWIETLHFRTEQSIEVEV